MPQSQPLHRIVSVTAFGLIIGLAAAAPADASIVFADGDFQNWQSFTIDGPAGGQTGVITPAGGNPGAFWQVTTNTSQVTRTFHADPSLTYDPASGAIDFIVFSMDFKTFNTFGQGQGFSFAIEQDGVVYRASNQTSGSTPQWTAAAASGIAFSQNDFLTIDGLASPDFTNGGVITVGLLTWNSSGNGISVGYDNFSATITIVPAPAGLALLALAGLGAPRRRRS